MKLKPGTLLQGGKYRIEKVLGQGGFGITYLAEQIGLSRNVAVKEFFMKELCNRDDDTSHVSVPSVGSRDMVDRFRQKFIKEAQTIASMDNHHIIRIIEIFEENGTAYYVMEYLSGGSLAERIPSGGLPESEVLGYILHVAEALSYIHSEKILHLDVKPSNILFRKNEEAVLIDFGISKHYDDDGGSQTSSTPVGVSRGYAPLEQYKKGGVAQFSPATDIYSLGATLYKLLTGKTPPDADDIYEDGVPDLPPSVSSSLRNAVQQAMSPRRKDRPQSVEEFLELLDVPAEPADSGEETLLPEDVKEAHVEPSDASGSSRKYGSKRLMIAIAAVLVALLTLFLLFSGGVIDFPFGKGGDVADSLVVVPADTVAVDEPVSAPASETNPSRSADVEHTKPISASKVDPLDSQWENDLREYTSLMEKGEKYMKTDATLSQAKSNYEQALKYERKYSGTKYSHKFTEGASNALKILKKKMDLKEVKEAADAAAANAAPTFGFEAERMAEVQKDREETERKQKEEEGRKRNETSYTNGILRVNGVEYPMVYVSGGSFKMGATSEQGSDADTDESPVHRVTLSSYSLGKYEVTQELWDAVMGSNPSISKSARRPVVNVSWDECQDFIRKLNKLTGASFRLPTEAEWEFAARGGNSSRGYKYSGSNTLDDVAWYDGNSGSGAEDIGRKSPNELGLYDMSGNVSEWCEDWYGDYRRSSQTNPKGTGSGSLHVMRGGNYFHSAGCCRVSYRSNGGHAFRHAYIGLRLCH